MSDGDTLRQSLLHVFPLPGVWPASPGLPGCSLFPCSHSPPSFSLQEELEHLNQASEEINQVELQLDVSLFPRTLGWSLGMSLWVSLSCPDGESERNGCV